MVTVAKDSSSASEGEGETQAGAKSRSTRKSKSRSKGRSSSGSGGQQSPSRTLVTKEEKQEKPVAKETMAFENRAFNSDNEGLSDGAKVQETEFNGPRKSRRDREFDRDEVF